jgi:predicted PolB exonuclease-like 3'-5' exonuclease
MPLLVAQRLPISFSILDHTKKHMSFNGTDSESVEIFTRARKYDLIVWKSRHPLLNNYILDFLHGVKPDLLKVSFSDLITPLTVVELKICCSFVGRTG